MSWRAITEADVLTRISGDELAAIRAAALQTAQADPLAPTIAQFTMECRGFVAGCTENVLDADHTKVPEELIGYVCDRIVVPLMSRVAGLSIDKEEVRRDAAKAALGVFKDSVATCKFKIVQPTTATTDEIASPAPKFSDTRRVRTFDRQCSQDGI